MGILAGGQSRKSILPTWKYKYVNYLLRTAL
jgi:hypothetical protein